MIGALRVTLGLDSAAFEKGVDRSVKKMDAWALAGRRTGLALRGLAGLAATAGVALAGVFTASAVKNALDYAASLGEVASQLGITTKELQVYRYAATQVNLTQEEVEKGLAKLTLTIGKAGTGAKREAQYFEQLGIAIKDTEGNIRPTGDVLLDLADRLAAIPDPAQRAAAVFAIFGRAGQKLIPLLEGGSKGLKQFAEEAEKAGAVIAEGDIAKADETADKIEALNQQLRVNFSRIVAQNADAILGLTSALGSLITTMAQGLNLITQYPRLLGAVSGAIVGARFGGGPGAVAGAVAGVVGGNALGNATSDNNMDIKFRQKKLQEAVDAMNRLDKASKSPASGIFNIRRGEAGGTLKTAVKEVERQTALLREATALYRQQQAASNAMAGGPDLSDLLGTGGGGGRGGRGSAARDRVAEFRKELSELTKDIDAAFSNTRIPRSIETANDLRDKLADIGEKAKEAGVPVSQFAGELATMLARIAELEAEGLAEEAAEFARTVEELGKTVRNVDLGAMTPLEQRLQDVDDRFEDLRDRIQEQIDENRVLADVNEDAAQTMRDLEAILLRLDQAHRKATDAARAQFEAEKALRDLDAARMGQQIGNDITDLRRARGDEGVFTSKQLEVQQIERQLQAERMEALIRLREFEAQMDEARRAGDEEEVLRLTGLIDLQREYYDLVSETTAQQIVNTSRLQEGFQNLTDGIADALADMIVDFDFSFKGLLNVLRQTLRKQLSEDLSDTIGNLFRSILKNLFAGGFATGGTIPKGQWGIVGENGPEPVFAGDRDLRVFPNEVLGGAKGETHNWNISVSGPMSDRDARRTGMQVAAAAAQEMALARRRGYGR